MTDPRSRTRATVARTSTLPALMVQLLGWSLLAMAVVMALESAR